MCRRAVISTFLSIHHWLGYPAETPISECVVERFTAEVAVVGGGPAGLVCAIALAAAGVDTLLIAPPAAADHRTTALLAGSVTALETLGVWEACRPQAAPLRKIRIIDDTRGSCVRRRRYSMPPKSVWRRSATTSRTGILLRRSKRVPPRSSFRASRAERSRSRAMTPVSTIVHAGGEVRVRLVIGADGQRSLCRAAAGHRHARRCLSADGDHAQFISCASA